MIARRTELVKDAAAVGAGAAIGGILRFACYEATHALRGARARPWATVGVNVVGSFVLGAITASSSLPPRTKLLFGTGLCGAFTTYSTFAVDFVGMLEARELGRAAAYIGASNGLSIGAALLGAQTAIRRLPK